MLSAAVNLRSDFGNRASQQQQVLRSYSGNRAQALNEPARSTDSQRPASTAPGVAENPEAVLGYRRQGNSIALLSARPILGQRLDLSV